MVQVGSRLGAKLLVYSALVSAAALVLASALQLAWEYRKDLAAVDGRVELVQLGYGPALTSSAYRLDREQLEVTLQSALQIEDVRYIELRDAAVGGLGTVAVGEKIAERDRAQAELPLAYALPDGERVPVGTLTVQATLAGVNARLVDRAILIGISNLLTVAMVSLAILAIYRMGMTRHFDRIAEHVNRLDWHDLREPLSLDRPGAKPEQGDELDDLVATLNRMRKRLLQGQQKEREAREENEELQGQLQQAQRLETVGTLASGVAHDFNNILTPLVTCAEMAHHDAQHGEVREEDLEVVLMAAERAKALVKQLQAFGKKAPGDFRPVPLAEVFDKTLQLVRAAIPANVTLYEPELPPDLVVFGDALQLEQVLMNVAINASHAIGDRPGNLTFNVEGNQKPIAGSHLRSVRISVVDDGDGMSKEVAARIFEPFFTTKVAGRGTGLGMSVVHGIVSSHGGTIDVNSELGTGTAVHIHLPQRAEVVDGAEASAEIVPGRGTILLVDDELAVGAALARALGKLGYTVRRARSAEEAEQILRSDSERFDGILSDMTMPGRSGLELAEWVQAEGVDVPFLLMTGGELTAGQQARAALAIRAVLYKPIEVAQLSRTIAEAVSDRGASHEPTRH